MKRNIHFAWFILLLIFIGLLATQGIRLSFGAFIDPWQKQFATDRGTLSIISMVSFILYGLSQPIFGKLIDRYGVRKIFACNALLIGCSTIVTSFCTAPWQLVIVYGIISSIGFGGTSGTVAAVAVTNWFREKRGFAMGLIEAGFGAGQMVVVPASIFLIRYFGWKTTVVCMGLLLCCVVFPLLLFSLRDTPAEKDLQAYGETYREEAAVFAKSEATVAAKRLSFRDIAKTRSFWFLFFPFFVCGFTTTGLMDTHLVPFCYDMGYSDMITSAAVGLLAACNIAGTLLSGKIADVWSNRKMLGYIYALRACSMVILLVTNQEGWLLAFSILFGFVDFATVVPTQLLTTHYYKEYSLGVMLGWLSMSHQIGSALGAYLPGLLYGSFGGYRVSFVLATLLLVVASVFCFLLPEPGVGMESRKVKVETMAG